ncbi:MAG: hypothetical protein JW737_03850 [Acidobacteria bacterium]|nr:hypothetical protein [Acidobacteriota bacterium]
MDKDIKFISFKGNTTDAPPNTATAIETALKYNLDGIMLDVNYTKDEMIVCNGEFEENIIPGDNLNSSYTIDQIKKINLGDIYGSKFNGEKILTLEEALELIGDKTKVYLHLICGSRHFPNIEERVLDFLESRDMVEQAVLISLDHMALKWLKRVNSSLTTMAMNYARLANPIDFVMDINADGMVSFHFLLTQFIIDAAHRELLDAFAFPIKSYEDCEALIGMNVDGIISPDCKLLKEFKEKEF